jgi:sucrose-phosphate synthase
LIGSPLNTRIPSVRKSHSRWCLVTDIDGTLIGDRATTRALREAVLAERALIEARGGKLFWAIATGRHIADTCKVLVEHGFLPTDFDVLITAVGAELHLRGEGAHHEFPVVPHAGYHARLSTSGFDPHAVKQALAPLPFLEFQPDHEQVPYKVSYFAEDTEANQRAVADALATLSFSTCTVWSHDLYLDIAPHNGAKGGAVHHLIEEWQLDSDAVVAAGDSGNDHSMLERNWPAIVVGNAQRALRGLRGRPGVYFARRDFAAGVLEGLRAHGFLDGA